MHGLNFLKRAAVALATLGVVLPCPEVGAQDRTPAKHSAKSQIPDITLAAGGVFSGRVVDHSMNPLEGAEVVIKLGTTEIRRTLTDKNGLFTVNDLKGGVYQVSSGNTDGVFRLWTEKTAPPSARGQAVLVMGENGARGQFGFITPATLALTGGVVAAGTVAGFALTRKKNNNPGTISN
jgi:hypothetical protein